MLVTDVSDEHEITHSVPYHLESQPTQKIFRELLGKDRYLYLFIAGEFIEGIYSKYYHSDSEVNLRYICVRVFRISCFLFISLLANIC